MMQGEINFEVRQNMLQISNRLQREKHFCFDASPYPIGRWACVGIEMSGGQALQTCRTSNLNAPSLTPRWSRRRLRLEFMDGLSYTTVIEIAESLAGRRGSALDR